MGIVHHGRISGISAKISHLLRWIRFPEPQPKAGALDFDALQRLAETSPHLLEDIGIRSNDKRFATKDTTPNPRVGR